jgi:hypothetical protein
MCNSAPFESTHGRGGKWETGPSMSSKSLNFKGLNFMIADANENIRGIMHGLLRGYGATNVIDAIDGEAALRDIPVRNVDVLF